MKSKIIPPDGLVDHQMIRCHWLGQLYKVIYGGDKSFFDFIVKKTVSECQMIVFHATDKETKFCTSDIPVFMYINNIEVKSTNGIYWPISPDYCIFWGKGNADINKLQVRKAKKKQLK